MSLDRITEKVVEGTLVIIMNNDKENALDDKMCVRITNLLNDAAINKEITMAMLTGAGDFFSSGLDVFNSNFPSGELSTTLQAFVKALITFPKLMIAIVNGPASGIAAMALALFDFVFASEEAYFCTPVATLHEVEEACFSIIFPGLIGEKKAMDMLFSNYKMLASEALENGLVGNIYNGRGLHKISWEKMREISELLQQSMFLNKKCFVNFMLWKKINEKNF